MIPCPRHYFEVLFGKSVAYKFKYTIIPLLCQKNGAFYLKDKVSAHGVVLLVQLSWRVAPPWARHSHHHLGQCIHHHSGQYLEHSNDYHYCCSGAYRWPITCALKKNQIKLVCKLHYQLQKYKIKNVSSKKLIRQNQLKF